MKPARVFDGAAAWTRLSAEQQKTLGSLALELVAAQRLGRQADEMLELLDVDDAAAQVASRLSDAAGTQLLDRLFDLAGSLPHVFPERELLVPSRLGDWCRVCGCTQYDACEGGCSWVRPGLCSACAPRAVAPATGGLDA